MLKWIDAHIHVKDEPGIQLSVLMDAMRSIHVESGFEAINILGIPSWDREHIYQNLLGLLYKSLYNSDTYFFGGLEYYNYEQFPKSCDFESQLIKLLEMGADGIKLIESKPMVRKNIGYLPFTDAAYDGFFRSLCDKRIPVLWHVADPETFWHIDQVSQDIIDNGWFYGEGLFPGKEELYDEASVILDRYPDIPVLFAHMFFLSADINRADAFLDKYPNVRFDLTPGIEMYGNFALRTDEWQSFFVKHQNRIVFGTDGGWTTCQGMRSKIDHSKAAAANVRRFIETNDTYPFFGISAHGVRLPQDAAQKILADNFLQFAGCKPRMIDFDSVSAYCAQLLNSLRGNDAMFNRVSEIQTALYRSRLH